MEQLLTLLNLSTVEDLKYVRPNRVAAAVAVIAAAEVAKMLIYKRELIELSFCLLYIMILYTIHINEVRLKKCLSIILKCVRLLSIKRIHSSIKGGYIMALPREESNRAIITVLGRDQIGIIAWVSGLLVEYRVNILDISQTIINEFFTMIMVVELDPANLELIALSRMLEEEGKGKGLQVKIQHEDIFAYMHRI